ncbi:MAG: 30S ribosome-binding factor RbfA [Bacteroidales bacterium]|jgi:ribosome-binding factor A|nr:30S ribosome-binding factor RbfA [Bacteroidales bacterium]
MDSQRQQKIGRLLQKELSDILLRSEDFKHAMITVTRVNITPDLAYARVYLSVFTTQEKENIVGKIELHNREIRFQLGQRIRHQVRIIPELQFINDDTLDYLENIDNLLKQ